MSFGLIRDTIKLVEESIEELDEWYIEDVRIGVLYTGVKISGGYGGVAYTFLEDIFSNLHSKLCPRVNESLSGMQLSEAMRLSLSWNFLDAAVGVASLNAASQYVIEKRNYRLSDVDVVDLIEKGDRVVMIGDFKPILPKIRRKTDNLIIVEKSPSLTGGNALPYFAVEEVMPEADVAIVTGTTLVNKSIDRLLELGSSARHFALLGPTASIVPDIFFEKGGTAMMGVKINDVDKMLRVVSEAGGTRRLLSECAEKFAILKDF